MPKRRKKDVAEIFTTAHETGKCKTGCGRKARTEDFCGICYPKYLKGHFLQDGRVHPDIAAKERALKVKQEKRAKNKKARELKEDKKFLKEVFTRKMLTVLMEEHPDYREPKGCPKHNFWLSEAECMQRLFLLDHKQCKQCKVHDDKIPFLKDFVAIYAAKE